MPSAHATQAQVRQAVLRLRRVPGGGDHETLSSDLLFATSSVLVPGNTKVSGNSFHIQLEGLVPITVRGNTYYTPVRVTIPAGFPSVGEAEVFAVPSGNLTLARNDAIERPSGRVRIGRGESTVTSLLRGVSELFGSCPPLVAVRADVHEKHLKQAFTIAQTMTRGCMTKVKEPNGSTTFKGTIPMMYRGAEYHISAQLVFPQTFPYDPPQPMVLPVQNLVMVNAPYLDNEGHVQTEVGDHWPDRGGVKALFEEVIQLFSGTPPLRSDTSSSRGGTKKPRSRSPSPPPPNADDASGEDLCVICLCEKRTLVYVPCGHLALCATCGKDSRTARKCCICRTTATSLMRVYS